jgi:hypothetical protein
MLANEQNLVVSTTLFPGFLLPPFPPPFTLPTTHPVTRVVLATSYFGKFRSLTKHLSTGTELFDQRQRRASSLPNQADPASVQIPLIA